MAPHRVLIALTFALTVVACTDATTFQAESPATDETSPVDGEALEEQAAGGETTTGETATPETTTDGPVRWSYEDGSCEFDEPVEVETDCGWLTVPARWGDPDDPGVVRLHVGVFTGPDADRSAAPIVYLEGGPGGHALEAVPFSFSQLFEPLAARRRVVIFDQRGTGYSEPGLACPESVEADLANAAVADTVDVELERSLDALEECNRRLVVDGADLTGFNSVASAHDVDALRQALGVDEWNVLGISYGTRLGQTLMREHPAGTRAVVLDSVVPLHADLAADTARNFARAGDALFAACAADPACAAAYPGIEERFFDVVDAADDEPFAFEATNPLTGESFDFVATGDDLLGLAFDALYSRVALSGLPELVSRLEEGDTSGLSVYKAIDLANQGFLSEGMFLSVVCHEELPFATDSDFEAGLSGDPRYDRISVGALISGPVLRDVCADWGAGAAEPIEDETLASDIPTLVMAGEFDPVTPPSGGQHVADALDAASFFLFPGVGHAAMTEPCAQEMALAFFDDPSAPPDSSCIAAMEPPTFVIGELGEITLVDFSYEDVFVHGSGVRPEGWDDQGSGAFARTLTILDQTALVQQVVDGVPASFVVPQLASALGGDASAGPVDERAVGDRDWAFYRFDIPGAIADLAVADDDDQAFVVVLVTNNETDRAALLTEVLEPALEAIGP